MPASEPALVEPSPVDGHPPQPTASSSNLAIPIALRKGKRSYTNPISKFIFYDHLNSIFHQFALSMSSESIPRSCEEALLVPA